MAATYAGYGFDANDVLKEYVYNLAKKFDKELLKNCREDLEREPDSDDICEYITNEVTVAEYIRDIINEQEKLQNGIDFDVLVTYENYVVFDSIRFVEDSKRALYIKSQSEFINLISKYIPVDRIDFGNVYEGIEWADACFYIA